MRRINPTINGKRFEQVSKPTARKLFAQGREIYLNPCLMMPGNVWQGLHKASQADGQTFETTVNSFEYYNCSSERGKYANFYICIEPLTVTQAATEALNMWDNKRERNRLKKKYNAMFNPVIFADAFKAIQTVNCAEYIPNPARTPERKL